MLYRTYGFDVISAVVPSLIAPEIMSVQAMQAKHGAIFYLQYLYGTNKGTVSAGDVMNSPFTGAANDFNYSNDVIEGEVIGTGDGTTTSFSTTLAFTPLRAGTIILSVDGVAVATAGTVSNGVETLTAVSGGGVSAATVNLNTGAVSATFSTAPASNKSVTIEYRYDMDLTTTQFSQVDLDLKSVSIEAFPRKLRARWLLDAAYELQQMKGELVAA